MPPHRPSDFQARRVRAAIDSGQRRARGSWGLRPAVAVACVLLVAGAASAMVGRWLAHRARPSVPRATSPSSAAGPTPTRAAPPAATQPPTTPPLLEAPSPASPLSAQGAVPGVEPLVTAPVAAATHPRHVAPPVLAAPAVAPPGVGPAVTDGAPAAAAPADPAREMALLIAAQRALRVDHEAERAGVMLDDYLRHYPDGSLVEEALGLAIEAAAARDDDAHAAALGARYLRRYPAGRFAGAARAAERRLTTGD